MTNGDVTQYKKFYWKWRTFKKPFSNGTRNTFIKLQKHHSEEKQAIGS
jgi:hypothetical protein